MRVTKNKVIVVDYKLQRDNDAGTLVEETAGKDPLTFLFGHGQMLPEFESNLEGRVEGETVAFGIESEKAYGLVNEEAILELPIEHFKDASGNVSDTLVIGQMITMQDREGRSYRGKVIHRGLEKIKVDFNHPMAGVNLYFTVNIRSIRDATASEIDHGHVHGPGGHTH